MSYYWTAERMAVEERVWAVVLEMRETGGWNGDVFRRGMHTRGLHVWTRHLRWEYRRWLIMSAPTWMWMLGSALAGLPIGLWLGGVLLP